ncbi:MAG: type IV pilin [Candidatus Aenigmarchaeota archaeon]|nr:type IV pilin [Candidatus Aenigmarchaeota archaeon]NIP39925.1 type IV pilin [Candidatus Aenigmarchaeota archaeon]NIQ17644.1 type IV pilin [Candidatus Aenigmarchaeota archaeon]NIS72832.1 type IV pilin [Candidatus Aenigmarchaeota archaeon]
MRKGISPLIAVIMLIAFTMIVAGILAGWATTFVTTQREELQFCAKAQLLIQNANYNDTTKNLTIALFNTGDVPLRGFVARLTYANNTVASERSGLETLEIASQDIRTVTVSVDDTLDKVVIQSLQCRGAQDLIGKYDIRGLGYPAF